MSPAHPKILGTHTGHWPDETHCARCAQSLAQALRAQPLARAPFIVELQGPLGAGKTSFARHLLHALGVRGRVKSPTYALMESYRSDLGAPAAGALQATPCAVEIAHFDFYRLHEAQEWEDAGFRDPFAAPGLKLVEWAEQARGLLPEPDLRIILDPDPAPDAPDRRQVCIQALSAAGQRTMADGFAVDPVGLAGVGGTDAAKPDKTADPA